MILAFPRNSSSPYLYIRSKEGAGFGSWSSIRTTVADVAVALTSGNQTIGGNLTINDQRPLNSQLTNFDSVS